MLPRILASVILLISILYLPFWVSVVLALGAMIYFSHFFEVIALFFLSDLLFGAREERYFGIVFTSMILSVALLSLVEFAKKIMRFYPEKNK